MLSYVKFPNLKVRKLHSLQCSPLTFTLFICIWRLLWEGVCWSQGWKMGIIQSKQTIELLTKGDCSTYTYSSDGSATKHKNLFPTVHCLQTDCLIETLTEYILDITYFQLFSLPYTALFMLFSGKSQIMKNK